MDNVGGTVGTSRHRSPRLRPRIGLLAAAAVACVAHGYVAILFNDGPTPVRAWVVNGVLFAAVVVAGAYVVSYWTRRGAVVLATVGVAWVAVCTTGLALLYHGLSR